MNYYRRWNPEKESNEFFKVWSEESFMEGITLWRLWTEEGIEGKKGQEKSKIMFCVVDVATCKFKALPAGGGPTPCSDKYYVVAGKSYPGTTVVGSHPLVHLIEAGTGERFLTTTPSERGSK